MPLPDANICEKDERLEKERLCECTTLARIGCIKVPLMLYFEISRLTYAAAGFTLVSYS